MLLKNKSARLITIRTASESYQILPGHNPSIEVPNVLCEADFASALIENGDLVVECKNDASAEEIIGEYDEMSKSDLVALCENRDIEVIGRDTAKTLIAKLQE
jgi:hypothetical protein